MAIDRPATVEGHAGSTLVVRLYGHRIPGFNMAKTILPTRTCQNRRTCQTPGMRRFLTDIHCNLPNTRHLSGLAWGWSVLILEARRFVFASFNWLRHLARPIHGLPPALPTRLPQKELQKEWGR